MCIWPCIDTCVKHGSSCVLRLRETREAFVTVCAWLSTVLAKSEQQHGATGGIQTVPALNFTCQRMAAYRSLGKHTEQGTIPKSPEHLSAALESPAHPVAKSPALQACASGHSPFLRLHEHEQIDAQCRDSR